MVLFLFYGLILLFFVVYIYWGVFAVKKVIPHFVWAYSPSFLSSSSLILLLLWLVCLNYALSMSFCCLLCCYAVFLTW